MRISATIFVILILTYLVNASVLDPVIENVVHLKASKPPSGVSGIWKKKTIWKPRWVKEWKSAKVMKPVWRKVWSPVQIREWVPIPKPPPGWDSNSTPLIPIHPKPQKISKPLKDSIGHGSHAIHSAKIPLWDPVPYPESQQPPPLPFPQPLHNTDISCGKGGCDNSPSQTFNHQQISEIIGTKYQTPDYYQNPEYSETVNHLTRLPPEGNNWRPPQPLPDFQFDNRFNNFQALPEFLVPPKFQSLSPVANVPLIPIPPVEAQNGVPPWIPLPPENKVKGHFVTKETDQPYKFTFPEVGTPSRNNTNVHREVSQNSENTLKEDASSKVHPQANNEFIQEAQLVGEYHYSEFDLPNIKPQQVLDEKEQVKVKVQQKTKQEEVQKPKINHPVLDNKQKQALNKQPEVNNNPHVQKKHVPNSSHFHQAVLKEIFPTYKAEQSSDPVLKSSPPKNPPQLNQSTKLLPIVQNSNISVPNLHIQQQTEILQSINPIIIPPNHRFSSPSEIKIQKLNHNITKEPENNFKPENLLPKENNSVHLVFATTPSDYYQSLENSQKSTTMEPYEVIFSSSLQATTEAVTKSPVIIVTPANSKENS